MTLTPPAPAGALPWVLTAAAVSGVVAMTCAGLLPAVGLLVGGAALIGATASRAQVPRGARQLVAPAVVGVGVLLAMVVVGSAPAVHSPQRLALVVAAALVAQLLLADTVREQVVALTIAGLALLLAVGVAPGPAVVGALVLGWSAILAGLALLQAGHRPGTVAVVAVVADPSGVAPPPVDRTRLAVLVAASLLCAVLAGLLFPRTGGLSPESANRFAGGALSGRTGSLADGGPSRSADAFTSGVLDMRSRGELSDRVEVVEVPDDSPALWRGAVLDEYDGETWRSQQLGNGVSYLLPGSSPYDVSLAGTADGRPVAPGPDRRTDQVVLRDGFGGVVLSPGRPLSVDVAAQVASSEGALLLVPAGERPPSYRVTTASSEGDPARLRSAGVVDAAAHDLQAYTQLPASVSGRVRDLAASLVGGAPTTYDAVRAIEAHLEAGFTYRLDSPVPPDGQDAVDHFLFDARTGFCEQFAAAEVVLLRAAGVPARMATGFVDGDPTGRGTRMMTAANAHAWVEVWYPEVGWVASDPTAGVREAAGDPWWERLPDSARSRAWLAGGLVVMVALGWGVLVLVRRRRAAGGRRPGQPAASAHPARRPPPVLLAFGRLEDALALAGAPRAPAESPAELAARLPEPAASAVGVVEQVVYAERQPTGPAVDEAARALDDLAGRLLASAAEPAAVRR